MTDLEKIDFVFFYIRDKIKVGGNWGHNNIWTHVEKTPEAEINYTLFTEIINKLKKDGLLIENTPRDSQWTYHVTFEGLIFQGYVNKYSEDQKESQEARNLRQVTVDLQKQMNRLTGWIVFGTLATVVIGILTLLKDYLKCS